MTITTDRPVQHSALSSEGSTAQRRAALETERRAARIAAALHAEREKQRLTERLAFRAR